MLYAVGEDVNQLSHCGNWFGDFFKKPKIELLLNPPISLLGIQPKENKAFYQKET